MVAKPYDEKSLQVGLMMQQQQQTGDWGPINMVISYAYEDQHLFKELRTHLVSVEGALSVRVVDVSQLAAGEDRQQSITKHLNTADIILLLVSSDFLASDITFDLMERAIEKGMNNAVKVIPILLRSTDWLNTPLGELQSLPSSGRPITSSRDRDEAWLDVADNIRRICQDILSSRLSSPSKSFVENLPASPTTVESQRAVYKFTEVFVKSGFPYITLVEHNSLKKLKYIIDTPGRGVIIEGPSGIGKTTAVEKAMKELGLERMKYLSARNQQDLPLIQTLEQWHLGIVVIDDFHHLDTSLHQRMVDYLKFLADISSSTKKIVLIGIPHTHQRLVKLSFDLATRIDVFNMTRVDNNTVQRMIEKGEEALNIRFDRKSEIISAANGSLNIAQYICWHICFAEDVERTSQEALPQSVRCEVNTAVGDVMDELSIKFGDTLRYFAELGGHKNSTTLRLLEELAKCEDGFLPLLHLKSKRSDLASGVDRFINERWIETLY